METTHAVPHPTSHKKFYTSGWVWFGTYMGGPLAGAYFLSKNFENLDQDEYAQNAIRIGIIATVIIFGSLVFIPESVMDKIPRHFIPIVYTAVVASYMARYQEKAIKEHLAHGGAKYSGWKVTGIALLSLLLSVAYFFALVYFLPESWMA